MGAHPGYVRSGIKWNNTANLKYFTEENALTMFSAATKKKLKEKFSKDIENEKKMKDERKKILMKEYK